MRKASELGTLEVEQVWRARNVDNLSFKAIESKFDLRPAGGMTALMVCGIWESRKRAEAEWFSKGLAKHMAERFG